MSIKDVMADRDLELVRAAVAGQVLVAGQAGYDQVRRGRSLAVDERPRIVMVAEAAAGVVQAVRYARAHGMRIAPQGTGHGAASLEPLDGAMLLRTARMRQVGTARAQAGGVVGRDPRTAALPGLRRNRGCLPRRRVHRYRASGPLRRLGLELDTVTMIPAAALGQLNMDPIQPVPGESNGAFLADFPAAAIDALVAVAGPDAETLPDSAEVRHLGGVLARPAPAAGPSPASTRATGGTPPSRPTWSARCARMHAVKDALAPWHASYDYYNFEQTPVAAAGVLPPASARRLQEIKAAHPGQVIISAHPVWPTRP